MCCVCRPGCGAVIWSMANLSGTTPLKKTTRIPPAPLTDKTPSARRGSFWAPPLSMLAGWLAWSYVSCSGTHSYCEFTSAALLSYPIDTVFLWFSSLHSHGLSAYSFVMSLEERSRKQMSHVVPVSLDIRNGSSHQACSCCFVASLRGCWYLPDCKQILTIPGDSVSPGPVGEAVSEAGLYCSE